MWVFLLVIILFNWTFVHFIQHKSKTHHSTVREQKCRQNGKGSCWMNAIVLIKIEFYFAIYLLAGSWSSQLISWSFVATGIQSLPTRLHHSCIFVACLGCLPPDWCSTGSHARCEILCTEGFLYEAFYISCGDLGEKVKSASVIGVNWTETGRL